VSNELLVETNHEVLRHLDTCPACRTELAHRQDLRTTIRSAFDRAPTLRARPGFSEEVRVVVHQSMVTRPRGSFVRRWWPAVAGGLAAAAVLLLVLSGGSSLSAMARAAIGDHENCAVTFRLPELPMSLAEGASRYDREYLRLQDTPPDELRGPTGPIRVVDRHVCGFGGRRFAHIVLQYDGHLVSLLVADDEEAHRNEGPAPLRGLHGLLIVSFTTPGHRAFVISDLAGSQLNQLASILAQSVSSRLSA
jgi:hypothetical protein